MKKFSGHQSRYLGNILVQAEGLVGNIKNERLRDIAFERLLDNILSSVNHSHFRERSYFRINKKQNHRASRKFECLDWMDRSVNY